jgi:hypothetical protein
MKKIVLKVDDKLKTRLKIYCAENNTTQTELIIKLLSDLLGGRK